MVSDVRGGGALQPERRQPGLSRAADNRDPELVDGPKPHAAAARRTGPNGTGPDVADAQLACPARALALALWA